MYCDAKSSSPLPPDTSPSSDALMAFLPLRPTIAFPERASFSFFGGEAERSGRRLWSCEARRLPSSSPLACHVPGRIFEARLAAGDSSPLVCADGSRDRDFDLARTEPLSGDLSGDLSR